MTLPAQTIQAIAVSPGIAIGRVARVRGSNHLQEPNPHKITDDEINGELTRFIAALVETRKQLVELQDQVRDRLNSRDADIFEAHIMLVDDRTLLNEVEKRIKGEHVTAEYALFEATERFTAVFNGMQDEYLKERAADIRDVAARITANLNDDPHHDMELDDRRIIIATTLAPSETAQLDRSKVLGFAVETGSATSHTAILARAMKLPAVVGIPPELPETLTADDKLIIDGYTGKVIINPDGRTEEAYRLKAQAAGELLNELERENSLRPETTDGFMVQLAANLDSPETIGEVKKSGACGIGLFRTEYLFMNTSQLPTEEEQFEVYKDLLVKSGEQPVIIRTLDVGGDKFNTNIFRATEQNPFLGLRGIRLCLHERRDIFSTQLRALLRAGVYGNLRVMLPMVSSIREVNEVKQLVGELQEQLRREKLEFVSHLPLGVMIETPAAAILADRLAPLVDFFSIGTNDLVQYTMAIDRGNERVAYLYRPSHPAILELIRRTVEAARHNNIWVSICGQMASEPSLVPLLVGLGVHELSMAPSSIGMVRRVIRGLAMHEAEEAARQALACSNASDALAISEALLRKSAPEIANI
ncbi:phosphoenolpyruvate--protein phosphotransferase [Victivallis vadensis]|uniref:Phosphoenolpyruvate-protein phosphotransferase n=2 Tax=Victivallis vadensis TaxID=172901 RepID=A0A2U1B3Q7_9BACT|nr:phosphoenolpyruvate--protein phosphotransferase [Victivallis vadensis]PVY43324.1 phosphoenolpyruvate--protein phosphotransferase [Victivallis vadensis]PWM86761.1 MAG: phosphoenolpyruvate--protein phosphotransferase [Lentisphaerota bacterium]HJH05078.1 phosphoenolpyruvate--protein phosphotransferase [Victivallis vadensis]